MPIYEYFCQKCKQNFSALQSVGSTEKDTNCTECGSSRVKRVLSAFSCAAAGSGPAGGGAMSGGSGGM